MGINRAVEGRGSRNQDVDFEGRGPAQFFSGRKALVWPAGDTNKFCVYVTGGLP